MAHTHTHKPTHARPRPINTGGESQDVASFLNRAFELVVLTQKPNWTVSNGLPVNTHTPTRGLTCTKKQAWMFFYFYGSFGWMLGCKKMKAAISIYTEFTSDRVMKHYTMCFVFSSWRSRRILVLLYLAWPFVSLLPN